MTNENLIIVPPEQFRASLSDVVIGSTSVATTPSPYDIPEAILSYENEREGTFVFELKYMGPDEPFDIVKVRDDLQVKTGRNSKRLYAFVVHPHSRPFTKMIALQSLRDAVSELISSEKPSFARKDNYNLVSKVLKSVGEKVVESLPQSAA